MPMNPRLLRPLARFQAPAGDPFATLVSTRSTGNVFGSARSTTGYIKVEWWDGTSNVYGTGVAGNNISWSKAAGGAGSKTFYIYPSDASGNLSGALTALGCPNMLLTSLDVSGLTALTELACNINLLASLDLSGLTALVSLTCRQATIASLDVSGCTALTSMNCSDNGLTSLRAIGAGAGAAGTYHSLSSYLGGFQLQDNSLSAQALDQFYTDLATTTSGILFVGGRGGGNPGTTGDDPTIATAKGWTVYGS